MVTKMPERLFVSVNKHTPAHAEKLTNVYDKGLPLPPDVAAVRDAHLRYRYEQAEKGITWAAGALSGFKYALAILAVNSIEEAKKAQENDPYFFKGWSVPEKYFEWFIHMPLAKASPAHRAKLESGLREAGITPNPKPKVQWATPDNLFVCFSKNVPEQAKRLTNAYGKSLTLSPEAEALRREHLRYVYDLGERGVIWMGGPSADATIGLSIFAVNSIAEAQKARRNDPYYKNGMIKDDEYYEWTIHMPLSKASPGHKAKLVETLTRLGVLKA